mgnify:CR=1 FL=1
MIQRERGFILPLSIVLSFIFSAIVIHQIHLLENDRLFFQERQNFFQHQLLLQSASNEMQSLLEQSNTLLNDSGQFIFEQGMVHYEIINSNEHSITVRFESNTELPGERFATVMYNVDTYAIMKWTE